MLPEINSKKSLVILNKYYLLNNLEYSDTFNAFFTDFYNKL